MLHVLSKHEADVFVLEPHPSNPYLLMSGGYDMRVCLWNLARGVLLKVRLCLFSSAVPEAPARFTRPPRRSWMGNSARTAPSSPSATLMGR
jgi:WD40 repeat protein